MRTPSITSPLPFRFGFPLEKGDPEVVYFLRALFLLPSSSFRRHKIRQTVNTMKSSDLMIKGVAKHIETEEKKILKRKDQSCGCFSVIPLDTFCNCVETGCICQLDVLPPFLL